MTEHVPARRAVVMYKLVRITLVGVASVMILVTAAGLGVVTWQSLATDPAGGEPIQAATPPRRVLTVEGKQVVLPPGTWHVAAHFSREGTPSVDAPVSMVLLQVRNRTVMAAVLVQASRQGVPAPWGLAPGCQDAAFAYRQTLYASDHDGACAYAAFVDGTSSLSSADVDAAWRRAQREAVDQGWSMPASWMLVTYRITDPMDSLQVKYLFHPWPVADASMPVSAMLRRVYGERMAAWMTASWPAVTAGFRGRIGAAEDWPMTDWTRGDTPLSQQPLQQAAMTDAVRDSIGHFGAKTVGYHVLASMTDFVVAWGYLGSAAAAAGLSALGAMANGAVYVAQEIAWTYMDEPAAANRALPGAGQEMPLPR